MIFTLKCRSHKNYKGVRKTHCCWACWWKYTFHRGKIVRTPKPEPQQELPLNIGGGE